MASSFSTLSLSFSSSSHLSRSNIVFKNYAPLSHHPFSNLSLIKSSTTSTPTPTGHGGNQWISTAPIDEQSERKVFDESKIGVKGLIDKGLEKIPSIFVHDYAITKAINAADPNVDTKFQVPLIDIDVDGGVTNKDNRDKIISQLRDACERWGFFQIVNHGIPQQVLDKVIKAVIGFHEQDPEEKKKYYSRDASKRVVFNSNFFMYNVKSTLWKDTFMCKISPPQPDWDELPEIIRDEFNEYGQHILRVGSILYELLSESLGLDKNYFNDMGGSDGLYFKAHYSPACPEPDITLGSMAHTDFGLITICLENEIGGLQALYEGEYVEPPYIPGALSVNLGDMIQLMTNGKYKSVNHRGIVKNVGPRINLAGFLRTNQGSAYYERKYEPIKQLLSDDNPPKYKSVGLNEYITYYTDQGFGYDPLSDFELKK